MFKFVVVFAACFAYAAAGLVHPTAYAPLYAAGGSQQIDVRHNYDGTLSSYTTTPFAYTSPIASRYIAGAPVAPAAPAFTAAKYVAPSAVSTPFAAAPAAYAAHFAAPAKYVAPTDVATPFAVASPYAAAYAAPYSAGFAVPLAAAPTKVVV